jgi:hypothetical protein
VQQHEYIQPMLAVAVVPNEGYVILDFTSTTKVYLKSIGACVVFFFFLIWAFLDSLVFEY